MDTCDGCGGERAVAICVDCTQAYCPSCSTAHTRESATKTHLLLKNLPTEQDSPLGSNTGILCKICVAKKEADHLCIICKNLYCDDCHRRHGRITATKDHNMIQLYPWDSKCLTEQLRTTTSSVKNTAQAIKEIPSPERKLNRGTLFLEKTCASPGETKITRIRGLTILTDGRLLLIDSKNCCMKIFASEWYDIAARKDLKDEPRGVAAVSNDEVAISFDKREVRIYKLDRANNLWSDRSFRTEEKPFSISYSKKTFVIELGEGDDGHIVVTDFKGVVLHILREPLGLYTGNSIRLTHDHEKRAVYVVNVDGFVHCVNYEGNILWSTKINMPRGIALHGHTLYVASKADNKIYQVNTTDGKAYNFLSDKDKVSQPRYLAFQQAKNKLVVEVGSNINIYNVS